MKAGCVIVLVFGLATAVFASPDSLENVLKTAQRDMKVKTLNELFRAYINSDPVKAVGYSREALTLATEIGDRKGMAASFNNLGIAYRNQGALEKALEYYLISLHIYDSLKNKEGIASNKNNIGNIYSMKKDYGQAMKYFEESYHIFSELGDQRRIIGSLNNLGSLHSDLQLFEKALKYYSQASQLSEKIGLTFSDAVNNIGNLYFKQGNNEKAAEYFKRAQLLATNENDKLTELSILVNLGGLYTRMHEGAKAQQYLDSAMALCKSLQAFIFEPQILQLYATNYAMQGKMKEAYEGMILFDEAKEKIYGDESSRKIAQMEIAIDLKAKEKEVDELKMSDSIKSLQLRNTRMIIIIIVLAIFTGIALINLLYSRRANK